MKQRRTLHRILFLVAGAVLGIAGEAHAIIGRPLTPVSFAGVARRSVRRAAVVAPAMVGAGAYGYGYGAANYGYGAAAGTAAALTALPPGCSAYAPCGGAVYQPVYNGGTLVYVPQ